MSTRLKNCSITYGIKIFIDLDILEILVVPEKKSQDLSDLILGINFVLVKIYFCLSS